MKLNHSLGVGLVMIILLKKIKNSQQILFDASLTLLNVIFLTLFDKEKKIENQNYLRTHNHLITPWGKTANM